MPRLLKQGNTHKLDVTHLIEELEEMGRNNLGELESRYIALIRHLRYWQLQLETLAEQSKEFEGKSWRKSVMQQRAQIAFLLQKVPSLKGALDVVVIEDYPNARRLAIRETVLAPGLFPSECPYRIAQLLDDEFYPASAF